MSSDEVGGRQGGSPVLAGLLIVGVLLGSLALLSPGSDLLAVGRMLGLAPDRYASPPSYTPGRGDFAFLHTQDGDPDDPVGYDPCSPIRYGVNTTDAPADWERLVHTGVEHTEWATGLDFTFAGETDLRPFNADQRDLLTARRQPVVIGFGDDSEYPRLEGDVAGLGGSTAFVERGLAVGRVYYTTGSIVLDTDVFTDGGADDEDLQAIVDHELAHVVGLDHVDSPKELMHAQSFGRTTYGDGDLEGLGRLGSIPCR